MDKQVKAERAWRIPQYRHRGEQHFIFERVPARVCKARGHRYFSFDVVETTERLMADPATHAHAKPVPVVALSGQ